MRSISEKIKNVELSDSDNFIQLAKAADLDPGRDFMYMNLCDVDFDACDLSGFNFTGALLDGARFRGSYIVGAVFDNRQLTLPELREARDWLEFSTVSPKGGPPLSDAIILSEKDVGSREINQDSVDQSIDELRSVGIEINKEAFSEVNNNAYENYIRSHSGVATHYEEGEIYYLLLNAIRRGHNIVLKRLLDNLRYMDSDLRGFMSKVVMFSVAQNNIEAISEILDGGLRVEDANSANGLSALYVAAKLGFVEAVDRLLEGGADPDIGNLRDGTTPLMEACKQSHVKVVHRLLKSESNLDLRRNVDGCTALMIAAANTKSVDIVQILMRYGADASLTNNDGRTALEIAIAEENNAGASILRGT